MFHLIGSIDPAANSHKEDVARTKRALAALGLFNGPTDGIPVRGLFDAIRALQRTTGLAADGVMKPEGPTARALGLLMTRDGRDAHEPARQTANAGAASSVNSVATVNVAVGVNAAVVVNAVAVAAAAAYVPVLGRGRR